MFQKKFNYHKNIHFIYALIFLQAILKYKSVLKGNLDIYHFDFQALQLWKVDWMCIIIHRFAGQRFRVMRQEDCHEFKVSLGYIVGQASK